MKMPDYGCFDVILFLGDMHHHKNIQFQKQDTVCYCIYGCSIFDSETGNIKNVFAE